MAGEQKKKALVLSGGGAKGAFQVGALEVLLDQPNYQHFDVIAGISVGALNGVMVSMGQFDRLTELWDEVKGHPEKVYKGMVKPDGDITALSAIWQAIIRWKKKSILDLAPLRELIDRTVPLDDQGNIPVLPGVELRVGAVSLLHGELKAFDPKKVDGKTFKQAVLASASMPIIWQPIQIDSEGSHAVWIDGGVRDTSPIKFAIEQAVDEIVVINCTPEDIPLPLKQPGEIKHILDVFKRSLVDIAMNEVFLSDLSTFLKINDLLELMEQQYGAGKEIIREDGRPYRKIKSLIIEPDRHLPDVLNFTPEAIDNSREHGKQRARAALGLPVPQP